jgi:hypothetical protein
LTGDITIAVQPDPSLGVRALAGSNNGTVRIAIDKGLPREGVAKTFQKQEQVESPGYEGKPVRIEIRATTDHGKVVVAAMPAAPLPSK